VGPQKSLRCGFNGSFVSRLLFSLLCLMVETICWARHGKALGVSCQGVMACYVLQGIQGIKFGLY